MTIRDRAIRFLTAGLAAAVVNIGTPIDLGNVPPSEPASRAVALKPWRKTRFRPRLSPLPINRTRWLQADVEAADRMACQGDLALVGQIYRAFQRDGALQGILGTRTGGLMRLPRSFRGAEQVVASLRGSETERGLFEKIFPQAELEQLDADGIVVGIGVAQFVQGELDEYPVLVRLDPEFLVYRWSEDTWYYRSLEGLIPIKPGDGRWVLHTPRGRHEPWNKGSWKALARAYVSKEHAILHRENYSGKLANPARVAIMPQGGSEEQKQGFFQKVMAWGVNTVFGLTPGYDVKLLESNGRGYDVFKDTIETSDREYEISIAGQEVTTDGGAGFQNSNIHATIRSDLIQGDGGSLATTLDTQAFPVVCATFFPEEPANDTGVSWDTRPPADLNAGAQSLSSAANAISDLTESLKPHGYEPNVEAIAAQYGVPIRRIGESKESSPALPPAVAAPIDPEPETAQQSDPMQPEAVAA